MTPLRIAWLGDVVGRAGRVSVTHAAPLLRSEHGASVLIANAENTRHGRGLHPSGYQEIRAAGIDAMTLGDHTADDQRLRPILEDPDEPIAKPANLAQWPSAKTSIRLPPHPGIDAPIHVVTILGRLFMRFEAEPPFDALDRAVEAIVRREPDAMVLVEIHAEATSEKIAMVWHSRRRWPDHILAVVGSHTHVQTSDARLIDDRLATITDLGMCGSRRSVIGFDIQASLERFRGERTTPLDVAEEEPAAEGCLIDLDTQSRRAVGIEAFRIEVR